MCKEVEVMWTIYGVWLFNKFYGIKIFHQRGHEHSVTFDWRNGLNRFVLGWEHTHPDPFGCNPSSTDNKTMRSWVRGKGKAMICGIYCDRKEKWYLYKRKGGWGEIVKVDLIVKNFWNFLWGSQSGPPEFV